jgi:hypothetical protein
VVAAFFKDLAEVGAPLATSFIVDDKPSHLRVQRGRSTANTETP